MKCHAGENGQKSDIKKECARCNKGFISSFSLVNHKCIQNVDCDICDIFQCKKDYYNHTCEGEERVKVKCFVFKSMFSPLGQSLEKHIKRFHSKTEKKKIG